MRVAVAIALADRISAGTLDGWVFFDRGLVDTAAGLRYLTGEPVLAALGHAPRYHHRMVPMPLWPEIYVTDRERRHGWRNDPTSSWMRRRKAATASTEVVSSVRGPVAAFES